MYIYCDVSSAVHGKAGLKRYSESLVAALRPRLGQRLRVFHNSLGKVAPLAGWDGAPAAGTCLGYRPWRGAVLAAQWTRYGMDALLPEADLFHATEHLLPSLRSIPTVLTVHDLIWERYPRYHRLRNYVYLHVAMPLFCRRASALIAVSESTKRDLVTLYGIPGHRVRVIPEAAAPRFCKQDEGSVTRVMQRYGLPPVYAVAVGTIEPRKNLSRLVAACEPLFAERRLDALVLVGARGWLDKSLFQQIENSPWKNHVQVLGYVPDEDLPPIYAGASATVVPSLYEGFGLPVLEAMACGSPVCCSNASSLPEVAGGAALYFDPLETGDITEQLRRVLTDLALADDLRERGLARARDFSWDRVARETIAVYEGTLGHPLLS